MQKKNQTCVGIIFGGMSNEHDVSINSAKNIYKAFLKLKNKIFKIRLFYINNYGVWFDNKISESILTGDKKTYKKINKSFTPKKTNFMEDLNFNEIDVWFPIIHGTNGEDGTIQGLLKLTQKPFIGSGVLGSALGMDKIAMKLIFSHLKIPQVNYFPIQLQKLSCDNKNMENLANIILERLNFPIFIKPSNSGSSLGVSKAHNKQEIIKGLEEALKIDLRIIAEEGHDIRELECGIIGKLNLETSLIGEVKYGKEWYDYESKYSMQNEIVIPAKINRSIENNLKELAIKGCKALNIDGFARADFFLEKKTNKIFLNEINTIPGFTDKSMFPMLWKASGLEIDQLVAKLVDIAFVT